RFFPTLNNIPHNFTCSLVVAGHNVSAPFDGRSFRVSSALPRLLFLALTITLTMSSAFAQPDNWKGGAGNWSNGLLWDDGVPTSGSDVAITTGNDQTMLDIDSTVHSVSLGRDVGRSDLVNIGRQKLTVTGGFDITEFGYLAFWSGSAIAIGGHLTNTGEVSLGYYRSPGPVAVNVAGVTTNNYHGGITLQAGSTLTTSGLTNSGGVYVQDSSTLKVNGDLWNKTRQSQFWTERVDNGATAAANKVVVTGSLINEGFINFSDYGDFVSASRLENSALIDLEATIQVGTGPRNPLPGYYQFTDGIFALHIDEGGDSLL